MRTQRPEASTKIPPASPFPVELEIGDAEGAPPEPPGSADVEVAVLGQ